METQKIIVLRHVVRDTKRPYLKPLLSSMESYFRRTTSDVRLGLTASAKKGKRKRQKTGLNRSVLDVGMGKLRSAIEYKLAEAGGVFVEVPTVKVKPSQTCPECGHQEKKTLEQRVHDCVKCGYTEDRDVAAAQVMLNWARGQELASINVDGSSSTSCGSMKQLALVLRQKRLTASLSGETPRDSLGGE